MLAWAPDSGSSTPTFKGAPCARTMRNGAVPASNPAAPAPAAKLRRLKPARAEVVGDLRIIRVPPRYGDDAGIGRRAPHVPYSSIQDAMGTRARSAKVGTGFASERALAP